MCSADVAPFDWECIAPRQFGGGACAIDSSRDLATTRRCQIHVNGKIKKNERGFVLHRWQWKGTCKLLDSLPTRSNEPAGGASGETSCRLFLASGKETFSNFPFSQAQNA